MAIKIITPPAVEPISLSDAKLLLKIDGTDRDTELTLAIKSAREFCEDYQSKKYITQTLELVLDDFKSEIEFTSCSPVQSVTSIKYTDSAGIESTIDAADYILDNDSFVNKIVPAYNKLWPSTILQPISAVRIRFVAGYGLAVAVPETVKWAMLLHMRLLLDDYKPDERLRLEQSRNSLLGMRRVIPV
jgi:uncharacterized phiE125 gp8 family phage protein